ncbi:hypothetical protein M0L70_RS01195 [Providencia rettgeri]|nr:hypothetical protein [Providencia rettgeri]
MIYSTNFQKWGSANDLKCAEWLFERKCEVFKDLGLKAPKEPNFTEWANEVRLMVSVDGHSHKEICQFYKRVTQDDFWKKNVQCPRTLRNQWDDLTLRLAGEQKVKVDAVERDEAFTRIIGSRSKPKNRIEEIASELAGKSGVRRMTDFVGRKAWVGIWQQAAEQAAKEVTA